MYSDHFTLLVVSNVFAKLWNSATISLPYTLHSTLEHTDFAQARPSGGVATLDSYVFLRRTALYLLSLLTFRPLFTLTTVRSRVWDVTVIPWKLPRPIACGSNCG